MLFELKTKPWSLRVVFSNWVLDKKSGDFSTRHDEALLPRILSIGDYDVALLQNSLKGAIEDLYADPG